ncbi:MAG: hypothetical protein WD009_06275 [Phycisphaeraceae bacterium]
MKRLFRTTRTLKSLAAAAALAGPALLLAPDAQAVDAVNPQQYLQNVLRNGNLHNTTGEFFAWHAASAADDFVQAYEATEDPAWLDAAASYYDFYFDRLEEDPDGHLGWIGETVTGDPGIRGDALVGDAILLRAPLRFAEIVLNNPELEERFGDKAREYVDLATRIAWDKWNERGTYHLDNGFGSYHTHHQYIDVDTGEWVDRSSRVISDNLNKHYAIGIVILRLHRITGEEQYAQRVFEIYSRLKSMFRHFPEDNRVSWNFWMPHGPYDIEGRSPTSWVAVHPNRPGYQASEVGRIVEVYDTGLVFDEDDIQRLINTNHYMEQGDGWRSSDGSTDAGTRWSSLARFDEHIYDAYRSSLENSDSDGSRIRLAYLENVLKPIGWERRYIQSEDDVRTYDREPEPGVHLSMNQVIPATLETANNDRAVLATQVRGSGNLRIALLDAETGQELGTLHEERVTGDNAQYVMPRWDGTNPATGEKDLGAYRVQWSFRGETRVQDVRVTEGEQRDDPNAPDVLQPGGHIAIDFTDELDPGQWTLEGAARSDERARVGDHSLRLGAGDTARFMFGDQDNLPVRITMWVHEEGVRRSGGNGEGPRWGVVTGIGDILAIRIAWRGYLAGDQEYAWTNTGDNRWFNLSGSDVPRRAGWSQWVFDFTDPQNPRISANRQDANISTQSTPKGAAGLYFSGSSDAGPLYIDDILIEYPDR